jgi:hypothetical protein
VTPEFLELLSENAAPFLLDPEEWSAPYLVAPLTVEDGTRGCIAASMPGSEPDLRERPLRLIAGLAPGEARDREREQLESRIVFVCDAFHAMTTDRPYRGRLSVEEAAARLRQGAGSQFDPDVVRAFVVLLEEHGDELSPV